MTTAIIHSGQDFEVWILRMIREAKEEICISTFRFENPLNKKSKVLDKLFFSLANARKRKVKIRVLMNLYDEKIRAGQVNKKTHRELRKMGIEVKRPPGNICNHAKIFLTDQKRMIIGSHNITRHSFGGNFEVSLFSSDQPIVSQMYKIFDDSFNTFISL